MKKIIALIISIIMMIGMCACSVTVDTPDGTVDNFLNAMKNGDTDELIIYSKNNDINTLLNNNLSEENSNKLYDALMKNLSWEIISVEENEEQTEATVKVEVTNADFSKVLKSYQDKAVKYMMDSIYKDEVTKDVMRKECVKLFVGQVEKASEKKDNLVTVPLEIKLTKNDSYGWDMNITKQITKAAIGGMKWPSK